MNYVIYDLATLSKKRLGYDLATLWKRLWIRNISRFVYAFSWTYVASCLGQLGLFKENLKIRIKVKAIYVNIYLFIYVFCCALLSCKLAAYPGAFAIKMYTLVYFSPKVNLLERKYHHKNQSINLIGLAHVGKAYSRNRLFLGPNRPYWRELRPLVTPWVKSIKEGTDSWRNQKWALLSQFIDLNHYKE